jgi:hypothetical protein
MAAEAMTTDGAAAAAAALASPAIPEVVGLGEVETLREALDQGLVQHPPLCSWGGWQTWRGEYGKRPPIPMGPAGGTAPGTTSARSEFSARESRLRVETMAYLYGPDWKQQLKDLGEPPGGAEGTAQGGAPPPDLSAATAGVAGPGGGAAAPSEPASSEFSQGSWVGMPMDELMSVMNHLFDQLSRILPTTRLGPFVRSLSLSHARSRSRGPTCSVTSIELRLWWPCTGTMTRRQLGNCAPGSP